MEVFFAIFVEVADQSVHLTGDHGQEAMVGAVFA